MKKLLCAVLALAMCLGLVGTALAEPWPVAPGESFTIYVKQQSIQPDYEDMWVFHKYEEMTGIDIQWTNVPQDVANERMSTTLAGGDLPDAFMKFNIAPATLLSYGSSGDFIDLAPYIEKNMPNLTAYMNENPDVRASITAPDGCIYSLPAIADAPSTRINLKWFYNQQWLDNLGLAQPTTTEELYEVLKAFKEQDANGNGDPTDEVPLLTSFDNLYQTLGGLFGLFNRGAAHQQSWDMDPETGVLRYVRTSDQWRALLTYMNRLYAENLLAQESATYQLNDLIALCAQDRTGMYVMTNLSRLSGDVAERFLPINTMLAGPNGDKVWSATRSHLHSVGSIVVTADCKNPELLLQWADYFYSPEGVNFFFYGVEGETYVKNEDGSNSFMDWVMAPMAEGKSYDECQALINCCSGGNCPSMMSWPGFSGMELTPKPIEASELLKDYLPEIVWPILNYTEEENEIVTTTGSDIDSYAKSMASKFVTGAEPLTDENWAAYVQTIEKMGLAEYYDAMNGAATRAEDFMTK